MTAGRSESVRSCTGMVRPGPRSPLARRRTNPSGRWQWLGPTTGPLSSVSMVASDDGWAVGSAILHWDGDVWNEVPSPTAGPLNSVSMVTSDDGWAVGNEGTMLHWDGRSWIEYMS